MPSQYIYRFIKFSWGLYVNLTADWIAQSDFKGTAREVIPGVHLSISVTSGLSAEEHKFLVLAIQLAKPELEVRLKGQPPIVIHIVDVGIVLTDYASEGLTYALLGWMAQELGIDTALPVPTFDKKNNRYVFPAIFSTDE
jgi:hypothetical protein